MTVGFVAVFAVFGALVAPLALSIEKYLPVVTIVVGVLLVVAGGWLLAGHTLALPALRRRGVAPSQSWPSQVGYGATFALVSLSCTLGPFLAVTGSALSAGGPADVVASFVVYALGMGAVVTVLAAGAVLSSSVAVRMRRAVPVISRLSGLLLVVAGAYVAWYGWFELRVLAGATTRDPVVTAALTLQGRLTRTVIDLGAAPLLGAAIAVVAVGASLALRRRAENTEVPAGAGARRDSSS
jgi:cytochrome c biogenesis protein CcdA